MVAPHPYAHFSCYEPWTERDREPTTANDFGVHEYLTRRVPPGPAES